MLVDVKYLDGQNKGKPDIDSRPVMINTLAMLAVIFSAALIVPTLWLLLRIKWYFQDRKTRRNGETYESPVSLAAMISPLWRRHHVCITATATSPRTANNTNFMVVIFCHPRRKLFTLKARAPMEYRSNNDPEDDGWHFCRSCSKWPLRRFNVLWLDKPAKHLKMCDECLSLTSTVALTVPAGLPALSSLPKRP